MNEAETRAELIDPAMKVADLGRPEEIGQVFAKFQKYLYLRAA
jgi:hypothetical protein